MALYACSLLMVRDSLWHSRLKGKSVPSSKSEVREKAGGRVTHEVNVDICHAPLVVEARDRREAKEKARKECEAGLAASTPDIACYRLHDVQVLEVKGGQGGLPDLGETWQ